MKTTKKAIALPVLLTLALLSTSWNFFNYPKPTGKFNSKSIPAAADILIQKIPGDDQHILIMGFYFKELISDDYLTIDNGGEKITFRDDGKGFDKKADDGLYTTKVSADVNQLRKMAQTINYYTSKRRKKTFRFDGRQIILNEIDSVNDRFDLAKFNAGIPISIMGIATSNPPDELTTHSLTITALPVVEDPTKTWNPCTQTGNVDGPWTFKTLMKQMASSDPNNLATDAQVSDFVKSWLTTWKSDQTINGDVAVARTAKMNTKILNPWLDKSLANGSPSGQLDMRFAPFKLTAIVNRLDLRDGTNAGEGRFVFCLITKDCNAAEQFNIIFEYGIPRSGCADVLAYAQQWYNLKDLEPGSMIYNLNLQDITDQFSKCGTSPLKPNQSSLNQLRSNEVTISPGPPFLWELREFVIDGSTHKLMPTTVKKEPIEKYNAKLDNTDVERMIRFINANTVAISQNNYGIPDSFESAPFLGGVSHTQNPPVGNASVVTHHWDGTDASTPLGYIQSDDVRQTLSLNTCSGCHGGETQTAFTQVDPVFFGTEATLSGFLTGKAGINGSVDFDNDNNNGIMTVIDAAGRPPGNPRFVGFNDLARRAVDLENFVNAPCGTLLNLRNKLMFQPLNMTH